MNNLLTEITWRMQDVLRVLSSRKTGEDVTFDDASTLALFYQDYKNTNRVIDAAEDLAHRDKEALLDCTTQLAQLLYDFSEINPEMWRKIDFIAIEQNHLRVFSLQWNEAKEKATKCWKQYQSDSNRLDMTPLDSEEYRLLDVQCAADKNAYEAASKRAKEFYDLYIQEKERCAHVHYFEIQFLELWVTKMSQIAEAIKRDTKRLTEEGHA